MFRCLIRVFQSSAFFSQEKACALQVTREMSAYAQWKQLSTRCEPWAAAKNARQDMKGIPGHLVVITTWLLRHRGVKHDPLVGNFLILSGAVRTSRRAHPQLPDSRGEVRMDGVAIATTLRRSRIPCSGGNPRSLSRSASSHILTPTIRSRT